MAKNPLAVVDTSVVLLLITDEKTASERDADRIEFTRARMLALKNDGAEFVLPSPVITELHQTSKDQGLEIAAATFAALGKQVRIEPLDLRSAGMAGRLGQRALERRDFPPPPDGRRGVKYDCLIAGIAHHLEARYLVTADPRGFAKHLEDLGSSTELVLADRQPERGQLVILEKKRKRK